MIESIILGFAFFAGQFVYGTIGFAGTIIVLIVGSFVIDPKLLLMIDLPIALIGNFILIYKLSKYIDYNILFEILVISIFGLLFGGILLYIVPSYMLLKIFAFVLLLIIFLDKMELKFSPLVEKILLFFSGVLQSFLGFSVLAIAVTRKKFKSQTSFLATFALYFAILNTIRLLQYNIQGLFKVSELLEYWWVIFVVLISLIFGSIFRTNLNEMVFKNFIIIFLILSGLFYLFIF